MASVHGPDYGGNAIEHALSCQMCHNGAADNTFEDMAEAHVGIVRDPSAGGEIGCYQCHDNDFTNNACETCHTSIAAANANSLHTNLWGEKAAIEARCDCTFDGSSYEDMFTNKCGGCHTTCGQCHVSRPNSVGGGFPKFGVVYSAHEFNRTPDMTENCMACHGSRIGVDYNEAPRDVHRTRGMKCESCHSAEEIHGDNQHQGDHYNHRYEVETMPRCETCHDSIEANLFHNAHVDGFVSSANLQCQVCHSQPYKNCTNCHNLDSGKGADKFEIEPSVFQFKIAHNPSPHRQEYDYVVVRHVPVDPDTYADWGLTLPGYLDVPTWKYASPHNVIKAAPQTAYDPDTQSCSVSCHQTPDTPEGFFLRESDLMDEGGVHLVDYDANIDLIITDDSPVFDEEE